MATSHNWSIIFIERFELPCPTKNSILDPSFEFNNLEYLSMIMDMHLSWETLHSTLKDCINYLLQEISEEDRLISLQENLKRVNHLEQYILDFMKK